METQNFYRLDDGEGLYAVWIWKGFDKRFESLTKGDSEAQKKVVAHIKRLSFNIPSQPEKAKPLRGELCRKFSVWELKPKPFRVSFVKVGKRCIVVGTIWRKKGHSRDSDEIEKACAEMAKILKLFKKEVSGCF
ncbi:hypothetical protein [Aquifex sp.]